MYIILEVIHLTLLTIAKGVFDVSYLIVLMLIFYLIKKVKQLNIYGFDWPFLHGHQLIESLLQGVVVGCFGSVIMTLLGLPIRITTAFLFLLPVAIVLSLIHPRFLCFSYSATLLSGLGLLFRGQEFLGITLPHFSIDSVGLMVLVGILHMMEASLVFMVGDKYAIPIITKKENQLIMGHLLQHFWPIPLALLIYTQGDVTGDILQMPEWWPLVKPHIATYGHLYYALLPIIGVLGYKTVTFAYTPAKKAKKSSIRLFLYSLGLLGLAILAAKSMVFRVIGILYMFLAHEAIIHYDLYIEDVKEPLYPLPKKGVRVLSLYPDGLGEQMGIEIGDIILKINGLEMHGSKDLIEKVNLKNPLLEMEVKKITGDIKTIISKVDEQTHLGIQAFPEKPSILLKYEGLNDFSLIQLIIKKLKNNI